MKACETCSSYGKKVRERKVRTKIRKRNKSKKRPDEFNLAPEYGKKVRKARENKDLKQEELAKKINEPSSVIKRIENEKMKPSEKLVSKLEGTLGVSLKFESDTEVDIDREDEDEPLTLGDVVKIKKNES